MEVYRVGDLSKTVTTTRAPTVLILNAIVAVWVFWDSVLSNCPPLQFRQWRDQEKDENHRGTPVNNCD